MCLLITSVLPLDFKEDALELEGTDSLARSVGVG